MSVRVLACIRDDVQQRLCQPGRVHVNMDGRRRHTDGQCVTPFDRESAHGLEGLRHEAGNRHPRWNQGQAA